MGTTFSHTGGSRRSCRRIHPLGARDVLIEASHATVKSVASGRRVQPCNSRFSSTLIILAAAAVFTLGCRNDEVLSPRDRALYKKELRYERLYPGEGDFRRLSREVPGFARFAYEPETSNVVVYLTNPANADFGAARVKELFDNRRKWGPRGHPMIVTKLVKYSFVDLEDRRDVINAELSRMRGITSLDIDEANNRLAIGVKNATAHAKVESMMRRLQFSEDSYAIQDNISCDFTGNCFDDGDNTVNPNSSEYTSASRGSSIA